MKEAGRDWMDTVFTAEELMALTDKDIQEIDALDGDEAAQARWWREWREKHPETRRDR